VLLDAVKRLGEDGRSFRLSFIGDGPERDNLEELSAKLGLNDHVRFTGDLRGGDLDRTVSDMAVVVMPSVWEETAGLSAIEQMMRGRVVIAADIGGLGEVVGDAGLKFDPGDAQALASCIQRIVADSSLAARLGLAARQRAVSLFKQESMVQTHLSLCHEAPN